MLVSVDIASAVCSSSPLVLCPFSGVLVEVTIGHWLLLFLIMRVSH